MFSCNWLKIELKLWNLMKFYGIILYLQQILQPKVNSNYLAKYNIITILQYYITYYSI